MPKQNTNTKQYTALDLADIHACFNKDLDLFRTAIHDIQIRITELKARVSPENEMYFIQLENVLSIYEYMVEGRSEHYQDLEDKYDLEHDVSTKGSI